MRTIEKTIYKFEELSERAKNKVRNDFVPDLCSFYHWQDELSQDAEFWEALQELKILYTENSQGPYWASYGEGLESVFSQWFTERKGRIKAILAAPRDDLHPIEKAFLSDCDDYFQYIAFDKWDESLFYDGDKFERFYASATLRAMSDYFYDTWEWANSDEYLIDHCEANNYEFFDNGELV